MTLGTDERPLEILLVEDNPGDVDLTQRVIAKSNYRCRTWVVEDGQEAMSFLLQQGEYIDRPRPDLILLDLVLPKISGWDLFSQLHRHRDLWLIPTIILTATKEDGLSLTFKQLHASRYCQKPLALERFNELARAIVETRTSMEPLFEPVIPEQI